MEGARGASREGPRAASPTALRRRPRAWRAPDGGGRRRLPRLLEEPDHGRDARAPAAARGAVRLARTDRREVPGRQDQAIRETQRPARRATGPARGEDRRGWRG